MRPEILRLSRVTQMERGAVVLQDINLHVFRGEVMGLVLRNQYGLGELLRLIQTNESIYYGHVWFDEVMVNSYRHSSMRANRVAVIEARSHLLANLSLADNIFVMRPGFRMRLIPEKRLERQVSRLLDGIGIAIPVSAQVSQLSVFNRCVVELLRAKVAGAKLIVLQELGSMIRTEQLERFHELVRGAALKGMSFLYVCNRRSEAESIADRIAIMENGRIKRVLEKEQWDRARPDAGRAAEAEEGDAQQAHQQAAKEIVLELRDTLAEQLSGKALILREGELIMLHNVSRRANQSLRDVFAGSGVPVIDENPRERMLFMNLSYMDNLCFLKECGSAGGSTKRKRIAEEWSERLRDVLQTQDISALTPYEQYDLVYNRIALVRPRAVLIIKPFTESDRALREHVANLIRGLQAQGAAILLTTLSDTDDGFFGKGAAHVYLK